jgi:hypothetical protein
MPINPLETHTTLQISHKDAVEVPTDRCSLCDADVEGLLLPRSLLLAKIKPTDGVKGSVPTRLTRTHGVLEQSFEEPTQSSVCAVERQLAQIEKIDLIAAIAQTADARRHCHHRCLRQHSLRQPGIHAYHGLWQ